MNPIVVGAGVVLAISLSGNAYLFNTLGQARERAARADAGRITAVAVAQTCSNYVQKLTADGARRAAEAKPLIEAAAAGAAEANRKADGEATRAPAVPGDACASAEAETREWLLRRQPKP